MTELIANRQHIDPEDTLPRMHADTPAQIEGRHHYGHEVKRALEASGSWDFTWFKRSVVEVPIQLSDGTKSTRRFHIRSISAEKMRQITRRNIRAGSALPRKAQLVVDPKTDMVVEATIQDSSHPNFEKTLDEFLASSADLKYDKFLWGLDERIVMGDKVIWDVDDPTNQDRDAAIALFNRMGMPEYVLDIVVEAIDALSSKGEAEDREDFLKQ